ncbi:eCIS core domain-containing protein [Roseiflexus sp.]
MNTTKIAHSRHSSQKNTQRAPQKHSAQRSTTRFETGFSHGLQRAITNPAITTPDEVIGLQRLIGNRAVQQLLASRTVQARLTVGPAHDRYEEEAEQVAQQVISTPAADRSQTVQDRVAVEAAHVRPPVDTSSHAVQHQADDEENLQETEAAEAAHVKPLVASITPVVQRQADDEEDLQETEAEEALQTGRLEQRQADDEEEEEVRAKGDMHRPEDRFAVEETFERRLAAARQNGQPLPESVRRDMEVRFGVDFSQVRIHTDPEADRLSQSIHAQAFTHGSDIYFEAGRYNADTDAGRALLAHELTHVVQQQAGRHEPVAQRLMDVQTLDRISLKHKQTTYLCNQLQKQ